MFGFLDMIFGNTHDKTCLILGLWVNWGTLCSGEEEKNEEEEDDGDEDQLNRELLIINRHIQKNAQKKTVQPTACQM